MVKERGLNYYKTDYTSFSVKNLLPKVIFSKNVQGWFFTRNYTFVWLQFAATYWITIRSDINIDREVAHQNNVEKWMVQ